MMIRRWGTKVTRVSFEKEEIKAVPKGVAQVKDVIDVTPPAFGSLQPEAGPATQVSKIETRIYCSVGNCSLDELEDLRKLETALALHQEVDLMLVIL